MHAEQLQHAEGHAETNHGYDDDGGVPPRRHRLGVESLGEGRIVPETVVDERSVKAPAQHEHYLPEGVTALAPRTRSGARRSGLKNRRSPNHEERRGDESEHAHGAVERYGCPSQPAACWKQLVAGEAETTEEDLSRSEAKPASDWTTAAWGHSESVRGAAAWTTRRRSARTMPPALVRLAS